ncbi:histone acetylation protein 2 [Camillea tinctor]|nr:histone acetylation protein 2 [Camillea tinctor]
MPPSAQSQHARSHALLLLQKLLNLRDGASPLTLILDTLEQSAKPVVREFMTRAKISKSRVIFVSFATLRKPAEADIFIKAWGKTPEALRAEITSHYPSPSSSSSGAPKTLLILDVLNPLCARAPSLLPLLLSSLIPSPTTSLVAVYHADVPLPSPPQYAPPPLALLSHLATAVLRVSSLPQACARRRARNLSRPEPEWGLGEGREGVLIGLRKGYGEEDGVVLEMELRRRSGRSVVERFVLTPSPSSTPSSNSNGIPKPSHKLGLASTSLLSEHPVFRDPSAGDAEAGEGGEAEQQPASTFSLGLTEKQRRDREGVVLPYFDAQTDVGAGEGGRILYEMGREDDFDDEEDEI